MGAASQKLGEPEPIYVIANAANAVLHIAGVELFGRKITIPAVFLTEEDALEALYSAETDYQLAGHRITKMCGSITLAS